MISVQRLTRRFGARAAVDDVSFEVARSEIVALLGPNGAGKTTTMRMLAGLIARSSGTIAIDGVGLTRATGAALRVRIGFLTESPGLWDRLTVRENLGVWLSATALALLGLGLVGVCILVALLSDAIFERETILIRWR